MEDYAERAADLAEQAAAERESFDPPDDPPDEERAMALLREGFGPAVWTYVEGRTGGRRADLDDETMDRLERAANTYLELYAACYGADRNPTVSLRQAAELLVETRNVRDAAELLTRVPDRDNHHKR